MNASKNKQDTDIYCNNDKYEKKKKKKTSTNASKNTWNAENTRSKLKNPL